MPHSPHLKTIVAVIVAVGAGAVAQGLVVGASAAWVTLVIGVLASAGVYVAPNTPQPPRRLPYDPERTTGDRGAVSLSLVEVCLLVLVLWAVGDAFGWWPI